MTVEILTFFSPARGHVLFIRCEHTNEQERLAALHSRNKKERRNHKKIFARKLQFRHPPSGCILKASKHWLVWNGSLERFNYILHVRKQLELLIERSERKKAHLVQNNPVASSECS